MKISMKHRIFGVGVICVLSLIAMVFALIYSARETKSAVFIPPPFEQEAVAGKPQVPESCSWSEIDVQVYRVSVCGELKYQQGKADVWFWNPEENQVWLKLRVMDEAGNILGETGILKPGTYVRSIAFLEPPKDGQTVFLKIMGYEPDTYHSSGSVILQTILAVE